MGRDCRCSWPKRSARVTVSSKTSWGGWGPNEQDLQRVGSQSPVPRQHTELLQPCHVDYTEDKGHMPGWEKAGENLPAPTGIEGGKNLSVVPTLVRPDSVDTLTSSTPLSVCSRPYPNQRLPLARGTLQKLSACAINSAKKYFGIANINNLNLLILD